MIKEIEKILLKEKERLNIVLVQGDTNTVLAGALASEKLHIYVGHVEAGLRSYDRKMPEEINRVVTDHVSDYLFSPTEISKKNLMKEGIPENRIFITGNTIVDAIYQNIEIANKKVDILKKFNLKPKGYFLVTTHRRENVDIKEKLKGIIEGLELIYERFSIPIIFPVHPRTQNKLSEFNLNTIHINNIQPVSFLEFLQLEANARLVITDSGGVQEETCIFKVPCITLRDNTERPETLISGSNILVGVNPTKILDGVELMLNRENNWENPFGDGKAGEKIIEVIEQKGLLC
jgi:UDP-N-acetylglucosamine 2-epimerase (non-hydrolysing)